MNGKDLLTKLGDIDQSYYAEAEGEGTSSAASPRILRKPLLVAALIAAAILLMGCAIAYVLSLKDMTLQEKPITIDRFSDDGLLIALIHDLTNLYIVRYVVIITFIIIVFFVIT